MPTRIYILDPGFVTGEGHHRGADGMLGTAALLRGAQPYIVAHASSPLSHIEHEGQDIPVLALLGQSPYLGAFRRSLDELLSLNESAYAQFQKLPDELFEGDPARILVHTTNETQVLGLARWIDENVGQRFEFAVVALMLPPPIRIGEDGEVTEDDPEACEIYRRAIGLLSANPKVRIFGIGATIAEDHARSAGAPVEPGGALVGGLGRELPQRPPNATPKVLLFMGDAKLDKGFHLLPAMVRLLSKTSLEARFVLHVSGSMTQRYAWVVEQLRAATRGDARFTLLEGRLSEEEYDGVFGDADLTTLTYHPGVYGRKTSGVCWDSINNGLPAVVVDRTWHALEFRRYDHPMVVAESFSPEAVVAALQKAISQLPELAQAAKASRIKFAQYNTPSFYVDAVLGLEPSEKLGAESESAIPDAAAAEQLASLAEELNFEAEQSSALPEETIPASQAKPAEPAEADQPQS